MPAVRSALLLAIAACGANHLAVDAATGDASGDAAETHALGMADVSILLPLPVDLTKPVLLKVSDGAPLVTEGTFTAVVFPDIGPKSGASFAYGDFQVVALRFDPCDGFAVGPCTPLSDGRLRLVLQPLFSMAGTTAVQDIAAHAFYGIPHDDLPGFISELRALARIQNLDPGAPLQVSPAALANNTAYLDRLRALVLRYATWDRLLRLTVIGQESDSAAFAWIFRGLDRPTVNAAFAPMTIPQVLKTKLTAQLTGGDVIYNIDPIISTPGGFPLAVNGINFGNAQPLDQIEAVSAMVEVENPALHDAIETPCVSCHIANYLAKKRAAEAGVDPATLAMTYRTTRNVAVASIADTDERTVRAFGWESTFPAISQRVANDTAQVLDVIAAHFGM